MANALWTISIEQYRGGVGGTLSAMRGARSGNASAAAKRANAAEKAAEKEDGGDDVSTLRHQFEQQQQKQAANANATAATSLNYPVIVFDGFQELLAALDSNKHSESEANQTRDLWFEKAITSKKKILQ